MVRARIGVGVLALALVVGVLIPSTFSQQTRVPNRVIERNMDIARGAPLKPHEQQLSGGVMQAVLDAESGEGRGRRPEREAEEGPGVRLRTLGCPNVFEGDFDNVRVNQDCSRRRQAEEQIVIDPTDSDHLIAGQNDSRIGFNHCGIDFSFDRGETWGDQLPPFWQFILKDGHTGDAGSDPAIAFDSQGNVYFTCIVFDVNFAANAIVVTKSNAAFGGTFFHSPNPAGGNQSLRTTPLGVVANDNDPNIFNDKEFMTADANRGSPKRDRVYVTWTRFSDDISPIFFSESRDGAATWSPGIEISGASPLCAPAVPAMQCNSDQGSWPVVGPDGTLYVFFNNGNTPTLVNQQMMVKCLGTADCRNKANWSAPVRVADDSATQPFFLGGPNEPGCNFGRQCLAPNGYRMNDFGAGAIDPRNGHLYFSWSDFRNGGPCTPGPGGLPVEPCANHNNDVFIVKSVDHGVHWSKPVLVSSDGRRAAHWQSWMTVGPDGTVWVAYYTRQYGRCEQTGCNDIQVAVSTDGGAHFEHSRITTASMPNLTPANNPFQAGFLGDYMSIAADDQGAVLVWADTRSVLTQVPEEDVYFAATTVEKHKGKKGDDD